MCTWFCFVFLKSFYERTSLHTEWQFVLDSAADRPRGSISILPLRLEECNVPGPLTQWSPVDLFEQDGYEKMMLVMKFQADMEGIALESHPNWKVKLDIPKPEPKSGGKKNRKSPLGWII